MNRIVASFVMSSTFSVSAALVCAQASDPGKNLSDTIVTLNPFTVSVQGDIGYSAAYTTGAARINMPVLDTAVSVVTLNEQFLRDMASVETLDAMKYVSGITYSGNPLSGTYTIRGYESTRDFRDGLADYDGVLPHDPFSTARLELIKGPEGVLFGSIGVGGVLNRVGKSSQPKDFTTVSLSAGSFNFVRSEFDLNRSLRENKLSYRIGGVYQDSKTYAGGPYDRRGVFAYVSWKPSPATSTWARFENQNPNVDITRSTYFMNDREQLPTFLPRDVSPDEHWDVDKFQLYSYELGLTHQLTSQLAMRLVLRGSTLNNYEERVIKTRVDFFDRNGRNLGREIRVGNTPAVDLSNGAIFGSILMGRQRYQHPNSSRKGSMALDITGDYQLLGARHLFFTYLGAQDFRSKDKTTVWSYSAFDFLKPHYTSSPGQESTGVGVVGTDTLNNSFSFNAGVQDNVELLNNRLIVSLGTRYDYESADLRQFVGNLTNFAMNRGLSYKFGVVGKLVKDISVYYNYTSTFLPQSGVDHNNVPYKNLLGVMNEVGVKWALFNQTLTGTAAVFASRLENQIISGDTLPNGRQQTFQVGENKTDGWETDIRWQPIPAWSLLIGYGDLTSVNQLRIRIRHAPQGPNYQLFSKYSFLKGPLNGLFVGLGYIFTNVRAGDNTDSFNLPAYHVADAVAGYGRGRWFFQVNVKNLLDNTYVATGGSPRRAVLGEFRSIRSMISYKF